MTREPAYADHFSSVAQYYALARPSYPPAVYAFVADIAPATRRLWDCATGNGQAAVGLSAEFETVDATDASERQIANARPMENIRYSVQQAESTGFPDACFDAVTVAQALHWFDIDAFTRELLRVLKPGGVFVAWAYSWFRIEPRIDTVIRENFLSPLSGYWPADNEKAWRGYAGIDMPLERVDTPSLEMVCEWDCAELLSYLSTWSALTRYRERHGSGLLESLAARLGPAWGDLSRRRQVRMDFHLRAWRDGAAP